MAKLRRHRKEAHPKAHKESIKKALRTKGLLDPLKVKVRRHLIKKPKVKGFTDLKGEGTIRVLWREHDYFPEFALYPKRTKGAMPKHLAEPLKDAGLKEEARGKWVLRTDKFSIFVYI